MPARSIASSRSRALRSSCSLMIVCPFQGAPQRAERAASAVAGDAVEPGGERSRVGQPRDATEDVEPDFLQGVLGGVATAEQFAQVVAQPRRVALHQFRKGSLVAGLAAQDQDT